MITATRSTIVTLTIIGCILALATFFAVRVAMEKYADSHAPDFAALQPETRIGYKDLSGHSFDLRTFDDKPLIVNAWASWSPFSKTELETLARLKREYADAFEVIAINRKETPETIAAYLSQIGDTEGIIFLQDETDQFFSTVTGFAMPESVFYNRDGNIVVHVRGSMTEADMRANIDAILKDTNE